MTKISEPQRLDQLLVALDLFPSRARARDAITRGTVTVNGKVVAKPSLSFPADAAITVDDPAQDYVSRAALKLVAALDHFRLDPAGHDCLDVGASTGGFTQVLLERGAAHVTAIDVGHDQMHPRLASDPRVTNLEGLNARYLAAEDYDERAITFIVSDVSFISLKLALAPALDLAEPGAFCVLLVKPQFEAGREAISKAGLLKEPETAPAVAAELERWMVEDLGWTSLGLIPSPIAGGDGNGPDGPVYVPYALPGEILAIARNGSHGTVMSTSNLSPDRVAPPCRHFGPDSDACGGCSLQHLADEPYHAFKRSLVVDALRSKGLTPEVGDLVIARPGERRRMVFSVRQTEKELLLGLNRAETNQIFSVIECPITSPGIVARLPAIRAVASSLATGSETFKVAVLETLTGLDLAAEGSRPLTDKQRRSVTETVLSLKGIARVSFNGEIVIEPQRPVVAFGSVQVSPPPGAFAQATIPAEEAMADLVLRHLGKSKRVIDLFAGSGTFALRLARMAKVHAVEGEDKPLRALDAAARNTQGLKPVTVEKRDLFRRPMTAQELKVYDGLVFDPPRAGAEAQVKEIARSGIKTVAAVSCNPLTLARDLRVLVEAGYRIRSVTPIDQFLWSTHVETVALLSR
eukprot:g25227.t1